MSTLEPEPYEIEIAVLSDTGSERGHNEDCCGKWMKRSTAALLAVADGMATVEGGELASQRAIVGLVRSFREQAAGLSQTQCLLRAARQASFEVYEMAVVVPQLRGMSTTLTAVAVSNAELTAAHVGNGRVYLVRDGHINQLSKDHTVAAEAQESNSQYLLKDSQALTRSLGSELLVPIDVFEIDLVQNDTVIICTDGLYRVLEDAQMAAIIKNLDASAACRKLVNEANALGTVDNLSVGIVRVIGETPAQV